MKNVLRIILLFFVSISAFSQGVCDLTTGVEKGAFEVPAAVCLGEPVNVQDKSGGTDIRYVFSYNSQPASALPSLSEPGPNASWPFIRAQTYTILQYGKKNGKDMYLCKKVVVREKSEPVFSYSGCNDNRVEIIIPNDPANNFDRYTIDWGDGNPPENVNPSDLPFKKYKDLNLPRTINVSGVFNTASTCLASTSKTIPFLGGSSGARNDPNLGVIRQLMLESADKAVLTIKGSYDPDGYNLFMTPQGTPYDFTPHKTGVQPGDVSISIPDTTQSYCFYIKRFNACGSEESGEICTVILSDVNRIDNNTQEIVWEPYATRMTTFPNEPIYGRFLTSTTKLIKEEDGVELPEMTVSGSPYIDNIDCKKKYCYRIQTETSGQLYFYTFQGVSLSKQICVAKEDFHPPKITDAFVSVDAANASEIRFNDNSSWTLQRDKYLLYHDNGTAFTEIMSNPVEAPFTDATVDNSQKSNCYKIAFVDECGSTSDLSDPFCTIFLSEANKGQLAWTGLTPFADVDVVDYEVESFDENTGTTSVVTSPALPATQLEYTPDLSSFVEEAKFRIKTTRADGSVGYSNTYTIPISVRLLLPDVFTPNNDTHNDNLQIKGTFRRITKFEFQIYNRWGNPVFTSDDPLRTWDGNFQGTMAPVDTYTYKIYAKINDGTEVSKTGKFLLMR